jgi:hypothetical protein
MKQYDEVNHDGEVEENWTHLKWGFYVEAGLENQSISAVVAEYHTQPAC